MIEASATRRNIVTEGVDLNALVGKRFRIGDALLEGIEPCDPCANLGGRLATASVPAPSVVREISRRRKQRIQPVPNGYFHLFVQLLGGPIRAYPSQLLPMILKYAQ